MAAGRQLRLLLWKDYLIRKRKLITLAGIAWATLVMMCLYVVRINVDNQDFPTCQFSARALPSAGMLTFVQSFVCSVNNDCSPMDQFQEIPTYENAKITQLQRHFSPLLHNETVLEVAGTVPDALKLLATLSDILDNPTMIDISKNGLKVSNLFSNPNRVRRYIVSELNVSNSVAENIMSSQVNIKGIFKGSINRCNPNSIGDLISIEDKDNLETIARKLCGLADKDVQKMAMHLLLEINFGKYLQMIGDMYFKLTGDRRLTTISGMVTAVLHMTTLDSYVPPAITTLFTGRDVDFSYFNVSIITNLVDKLEPTFAGTKAFNALRDIADMISSALGYLDKILVTKSSDPVKDTAKLVLTQVAGKMSTSSPNSISTAVTDAIALIENGTGNNSVDMFKILAQAINFLNKFLPDNTNHEVLFYSTLLAKLIEGATKIVDINLNIQEMAYDVSLRNPEGVKVLLSLPTSIVRKGFEGLADADRVQIVTSKLNVHGQIFCDSNKLAGFFKVSKHEADSLKKQLCTDAWKDYTGDFIRSFGIYYVRDIINNMMSIVVQETFGKDVKDQLYTIDKDFDILKNFTETLIRRESRPKREVDWNTLFNKTDESDFMKIFNENGHLGKQILISVHGALAKEVVKQNAILDYKISPILLDVTAVVNAMLAQLRQTPNSVTDDMKKWYPLVVETMLNTLLDADKTYRALSAVSEDVVCAGVDSAQSYLALPENNQEQILRALCNATRAIEAGLKNNSAIAKAIAALKTSSHAFEEVNWTQLINGIKNMYNKLDQDYPYLFEFATYGMNKEQRARVEGLMKQTKDYWFSTKRLYRSFHFSIKLVFRLLDVVDHDAFGLTSDSWRKMKHAFHSASGPLAVVDDLVKLLTALARNETVSTDLPSKTSETLSAIIPNVPQLVVQVVDMIVNGNVDLKPITSLMNMEPAWPCAPASLADVLPLSEEAKEAIMAMEHAICADEEVQNEWEEFVKEKNISSYNASTWNTTTTGPHVFLTFSSIFDRLVEDTTLIKQLIVDLVNNTKSEDGKLTIVGAWRYAASLFDGSDKNATLRTFFANIDSLLTSIDSPPTDKPINDLWKQYSKCKSSEDCGKLRRAALKHSFEAISVIVESVSGDLITYFMEIHEPDSNLLQIAGFTKSTGLYILFDKLPEFVAALLNSYWDYGFMSKIRRASQTDFWDCEEVLSALSPAADSTIDQDAIRKVRPYICPSLLYWISLPTGDNTFLDVLAMPQDIYYSYPAGNLTSSFENAFSNALQLHSLLADLSTKNDTALVEEDTSLTAMEKRLRKTVDYVFSYKIDENDPSYRLFNEINKKQFILTTYLARITAMVNKLSTAMESLTASSISSDYSESDAKKLDSEISYISKIFKRRPNEAITIHFDVITNALSSDDEFDLVKAFDAMCDDVNDTNNDILIDDQRSKYKICGKQYKVIYGAVQNVAADDAEEARKSLRNLVNTLQDSEQEMDVAKFFRDRKKLTNSLKSSIMYSYDLGLSIYLQYLQSNLQNYNIVLSFLSGGDWWAELKNLYDGPYATSFFEAVEKSFEVAEDVLTKLDDIRLVRLLKDVNVNDTTSICQQNVTLSDYLPDSTGTLSQLKLKICAADSTELYKEIPPLVFASQGFDDDLQLPRTVKYTALYSDISSTESRLESIRDGPQSPLRPKWITEDKIKHLRGIALKLLSKETLTKISFGVLGNVVDAGTLFLNTSQCTLCSHFTTWFKQLNLQLYKKQEYDNLMCHLDGMTLDEVHEVLKNEFHWDMAFRELISFRNYTNYELNKSMNELLGQIKLHLLEDVTANTSRVAECLAKNATMNEIGHASLLITVLAQTITLIRAELPHLHQIDGMKDVALFKSLSSQISPNLDVYAPLKAYLKEKNSFEEDVKKVLGDLAKEVDGADVNLRLLKRSLDQNTMEAFVNIQNRSRDDLCSTIDCVALLDVFKNNVQATLLGNDLSRLQEAEFWKFQFLSNVLYRAEQLLRHIGRLVGLVSTVDIPGVVEGKLAPTLDLLLAVLAEDSLESIVYSIHGVLQELQPLLNDTALEFDLRALTAGLQVLHQYKQELNKQDLRISVREVFLPPEQAEACLGALGVNTTNFWSLAAPRIHAGHITLKPLLSWKQGDHIANFVCQIEPMSRVIQPNNLDVVSQDDVLGAVAEQFCGIGDERAKQLVPALIQNINFTYVVDQVTASLLLKLYSASNLTEDEGSTVTRSLPRMAAVLPSVQAQISEVADAFSSDPLFKSLANFSSVGGLLGSSDFMSSAGNMLCGAPFVTDVPRLYRSVISSPDQADKPDEKQLEGLPTDFCRSLYTDIISVQGGKIVWSFVKPLIMGRILYTPANPTVDRIIKEANSSFAHMSRLAGLVHAVAAALPAVGGLAQHAGGAAVLPRLLSSPALEDLKTMLLGEGDVVNVDLPAVLDELGDVQGMGSLLSKASNLLRCVNLNRFHAAPSEESMAHEAARLTMLNEFSAGLVFLNSENQGHSLSNIEYKIRMDIENAPTTSRMKNYFWIPGPEANFLENMRYFRGFVQIQDLVDNAIIHVAQNASRRTKREAKEDQKWAVYTQQMPYPCYRKDFFQTSLYESQTLIVGFFFSLLFTVASAVRFVVADKESGNTMLMHVMGVNLTTHTLSWFLWCALEMLLTAACLTAVLCAGAVLPNTDSALVFILITVFGFSVLCFCYMISKLFQLASFAAVCTAIAYLLTFMPVVLILSLEAVITRTAKIIICLSMSSSLCYAFLHITRLEATGTGAHFAHMWDYTDDEDISIGLALVMMLVDAAIYVAVGWIIDRCCGLKTLQRNITYCTTTDEKAGVSILNVTKIYGEGSRRPKVALDNVSMELHKGQVTTLLGHNGAGKTTLIKILMGMLKPTKGHVIIRSESQSGTLLGVCPQKDVLFEHMTAREHIALYAQLKSGRSREEVQGEVESMLEVLNLGPVCEEPVSRLSGGTRRRLCVALAFVAEPHLVSLDEPTSGVDPAARRDIWSMIVKLKEDRTILLTTHHLDEAELLSDQIVIMHKGQVHTSGSPIEIKRSLGTGYSLSVSYDEPEGFDDTIEHRAKQLLTVVREAIKNANLSDIEGLDVEVALPFFDANGLNNDFLKLCTTLESNQELLGFRSYSLECSSLEQVFHNICQQANVPTHTIDYPTEYIPSKSASTSSVRTEGAALVPSDGPLTGTAIQQFKALMKTRFLHYKRNRWLLFVLLVLPSLFVAIAMGFSTVRPPADNEISLLLHPGLYPNTTAFIVPEPSIYSDNMDPAFAQHVLDYLMLDNPAKNWTDVDTPKCQCTGRMQECNETSVDKPGMMVLPDVDILNEWLVNSQKEYIQKRYGGFTASLSNNVTNLISWYNNKGHHSLPAFVSALNTAALRAATNNRNANITTYSHPMKISKEQISKDTVYQHVADAGISALVVLGYSLVSAGAAVYVVGSRRSQQKRLQLLAGVSAPLYWTAALAADMLIILINIVITAILMEAFHFPVFVERSNLPAICLLILLYGYACGCLVHVAEKLFTEPSVANMLLFCGNAFLGLGGLTVLLILDVISESDATDNARWVLHKIFMLSPQFVLGDGLLEIAKNTIQAQVLSRFGMDTYKEPLSSDLLTLHYTYLVVVGSVLFVLNLAIEMQYFDFLLVKIRSESIPEDSPSELEDPDVAAERKRVHASLAYHADAPLRLHTIGNINAGFVDTEQKSGARPLLAASVRLGKALRSARGTRLALRDLTLGLAPGQCTVLLGENGAGKSTMFSLLTGQLRPTTGAIHLRGHELKPTEMCKGLISYCPQTDAIDPLLTVKETLEIYCMLRGISEQEEVIKRAMETFELTRYSETLAGDLSGGNKRKLCTAIALMSRSPLVLLDEPTSGMDPGSRACVSRGVRSACACGRGVVLATHALRDARALAARGGAARVALLRKGRLSALRPMRDWHASGGYVVECRVAAGAGGAAWRAVRARAPRAVLNVLHRTALHFTMPDSATVDEKEVKTRPSDIFRLMAALQAACDIDDYAVTKPSLDQMFLSFSKRNDANVDSSLRADDLTDVTAL